MRFKQLGSIRITAMLCVAAISLAFEKPGSANDAEKQQQPQVWALLVAASDYPTLTPRQQLQGPPNDAKLVSTLLKDRFGVPDKNIVVLAEGLPDQLPTRSRIETEFQLLAERVQPGDQVLIMIAGHGSQQPDAAAGADERDGLDEIFLPRDIGKWNGDVGSVENAITDDELHAWLSHVRKKGTRVFLIADTCHSGTISRGESVVSRDVHSSLLGIPARAIDQAAKDAAASVSQGLAARGGPVDSPDITREVPSGDSEGSLIALYAALPHELTYEQVLPSGGQYHGWLTWALTKALSEPNHGRLTYRELAQRIQWYYEQNRWTSSHPMIEGSTADLDREVLGIKQWPGRSQIVLQRSDQGDYSINAGVLHGATPGSVLSAYAAGKDDPAGFLRVTKATALQADVEPVAFEHHPKVSELPVPARCELTYQELGDFKVWVSVDVTQVRDGNQQSVIRDQLNRAVQAAANSADAMLRLTPEGEIPDWYVIASEFGTSTRIVPSAELSRDEVGKPRLDELQTFGPYPVDDQLSSVLLEEFNKLARATNLRRIAELETGGNESIRLDVRIERLVDPRRLLYRPLSIVPTPDVRDQDSIQVVITNPTKSWVDVTVLYIQTDGKIDCFFPHPRKAEFNRLGPNESYVIKGIRINDDTIGLEDLIVIGVPREIGGTLPANFAFLSQPSLQKASETVQSRGSEEDFAWTSPLGLLSRGLVFNEPGASRGATASDLKSFGVYRLSWNVVKDER